MLKWGGHFQKSGQIQLALLTVLSKWQEIKLCKNLCEFINVYTVSRTNLEMSRENSLTVMCPGPTALSGYSLSLFSIFFYWIPPVIWLPRVATQLVPLFWVYIVKSNIWLYEIILDNFKKQNMIKWDKEKNMQK